MKMKKTRFVSNVEKATKALDSYFLAVKKNAASSWLDGIKALMNKPKTGRRYRLPSGGGFYTASAPGEAPAVRTGDLEESYEIRVSKRNNRAFVGTKLKYGFFLERGTRKFKKRPHIKPGFEEVRNEIEQELGRPMKEGEFGAPKRKGRRRRRRRGRRRR